jgi:AcrR family transcriptional regulator
MARPAIKKPGLMEAAIELFAAKGLARTSIRDIASQAGVTEGALYRHWASKDSMAWDLYCQTLEGFTEAFRSAVMDQPVIWGDFPADPSLAGLSPEAYDFALRVHSGVHYAYSYYRDHPAAFAFILLTQHGLPENEYPTESPYDIVEQIIGAQLAAMGRDDEGLAKLISAMLLGMILEPVMFHWRGWTEVHPLEQASVVAAGCLAVLERLTGASDG